MNRPYGRSRVFAPTAEEAASADRRSIESLGVPSKVLMENAGRSAAHIVSRLYPSGPVHAFVGPGNNGGDALVLLRTLASWGRSVRGYLIAPERSDPALLHGWESAGVECVELDASASLFAGGPTPAVLIDGLLGTGLVGPVRAPFDRLIRRIRETELPVVSLDIPSGVNGTTGKVEGEAVRAAVTIAFGWPKLGTLRFPGRIHAGRLIATENGFPPHLESEFGARLITPEWASGVAPSRDPVTHKNEVGSLLLLAGSTGMAGAAILAGRAALRSGVGLLRVASSGANREILQEALPEAIFVDAGDRAAYMDAMARSGAVAAGPGLEPDSAAVEWLERIHAEREGRPIVLDAGALTLIGSGSLPPLRSWVEAGPVLVTPHAGEMNRISGISSNRITEESVEVAHSFAGLDRVTLVLKGRPSVVASPNGTVWIETVGSSDLATAGMGDVLTGTIGALLACGLQSEIAGALALHWTGRAAIRAHRGAGLTPVDVCEALPDAATEIGPGDSELDLPFVLFDQDPPR